MFTLAKKYMLLAIDIGNTDAVFGFYEGDTLLTTFRIRASEEKQNNIYYAYRLGNFLLENNWQTVRFKRVVISSVVPELTDLFVEMGSSMCSKPPIIVDVTKYPKLKVTIDNPKELGTDLFANAVAAFERYKTNCIVVDFGTALTFTVVSKEAEVLGVAIAPGLKTAMNSLFSKTAQLPEVPLVLPQTAIGTNSVHAIQSGILFGYEGLVKHILQRIKTEIGSECIVIATGGLSSVIETLENEFDEIDRNLTLNGIQIIGKNAK